MQAARDGFATKYAREAQADTLADEILDIADDGSNDWMLRAAATARSHWPRIQRQSIAHGCGSIPGEPSNAYGHKESCLDAFLGYSETESEELEKWIRLLPKMLQLFDRLQLTFPEHYEGKFGKINEVQIYDEKKTEKSKKYRRTPAQTLFFEEEMKYSYPQGWIYPLYASFRFLAAPDSSGTVSWREDPVAFWDKHGREITSSYVPHIVAAGYDAKKIATNPLCYQAVRQKVTDLFKRTAA